MTFIEQLGADVAHSGAPPRPLRDLLELHIVDVLGAWLGALDTPEGIALLRWRRGLAEGALRAGALHGPVVDVAIPCALARLSEIDDIHLASTTTPGAIVIPGAVAMAAALGISDPGPLAAAMLAGYDVMTRLGQAIGGASALYRGIWPTYFTAPTAIAAVAARLLGLDAGKTAQALAFALVRASPGVGQHNAATTARWLAIGLAAEAGVTAALAAQAGFTCDLALLDGGFLSGIYGITPDPATLPGGPEQRSALTEVSFKPWCAARQTMAATEGLRQILSSGVEADAMTRIKAFVPPLHHRMVDHGVAAGDRSSFLTSLPYRLAVAALDPEAAFRLAPPAGEVPPNIRTFMARIEVAPAPELMANFPRQWPARIEVTTPTGRHERVIEHVPGDPHRPYDATAVQEKFRRFAIPAVGAEVAARVLDRALGLFDGQTDAAQLIQDIDDAAALQTS
jgi:2-methylcitrate dehydratase PrpD